MAADSQHLEGFLSLSALLTGFRQVDLVGTGMAGTYYQLVGSIVGEDVLAELSGSRLPDIHDAAFQAAVRRRIMEDPKLGPVARNLIKLWYLGTWNQLPEEWRADYGSSPLDVTHVVSPAAYRQGLVWKAIGAHPMGAEQPGFGTWSLPPRKA